jgi:hypothetical protein
MDSFMIQDEAVRERIKQAVDFLDPSMTPPSLSILPQD